MASIKGRDTTIELILRRALWKEGLRGYRVNMKLPGKPDIVFTKYQVAIFCDGDFWHGKNFEDWCSRLTPYWLEKIQKNIARDKKNDILLEEQGWHILHFWESQINSEITYCISRIKKELVQNMN